jgi:hypothetical protein
VFGILVASVLKDHPTIKTLLTLKLRCWNCHWIQQTEFELATRVPLLIKVPWATPSVGKRLDHFVELVDLHATLADLAGLPPTSPTALPDSVMVKQSRSFAGIFSQVGLVAFLPIWPRECIRWTKPTGTHIYSQTVCRSHRWSSRMPAFRSGLSAPK